VDVGELHADRGCGGVDPGRIRGQDDGSCAERRKGSASCDADHHDPPEVTWADPDEPETCDEDDWRPLDEVDVLVVVEVFDVEAELDSEVVPDVDSDVDPEVEPDVDFDVDPEVEPDAVASVTLESLAVLIAADALLEWPGKAAAAAA